jgi:SulP family sulfate permease
VGVIVSALVYSWKSSKVIRISLENQSSEDEKTYKLHGSVFFGSVNNLKTLIKPSNDKEKIVTLDCSDAWLWDQSAIEAIKTLTEKYNKVGKILKIKNLGPYSLRVVTKANKVFNINLVK